MISDYLNQTASWEVRTGTDTYGTPTFSNAVTIKCRIRKTESQVITDHSALLNARYIIHTTESVATGDRVNGMDVLTVDEYVNYAGVVIGVVAYT